MMKNCDEVRGHLGAVLDREATVMTRGAVEAHLAGCAACRGEHDALQGLQARVARMPLPALPADFTARTVQRALAAVERRRRGGAVRARFQEVLVRLADLVLGSARPAPVAFASVWRAALGGSVCIAALSVLSTFILVDALIHHSWYIEAPLIPTAMREASQEVPGLLPDVKLSPRELSFMVALPMLGLFLVGVRLLRVNAFVRSLRSAQPLSTLAVVAFFLGLFGVTLYAVLGLVGALLPLELGYANMTLAAQMLRIPVMLACGAALAVLYLRCLRGTFSLAMGFYATLAAAFAGYLAVGYVVSVVSSLEGGANTGIFLRVCSMDYVWRVVGTVVLSASMLLALLVTMAAWRPDVPRAARFRNVLAPGCAVAGFFLLVLGGYGAHIHNRLRNDWQMGQAIESTLGFDGVPGPTRSAILLAGERGVTVIPQKLSSKLAPANVERVAAFLRGNPRSLLAPDAFRLYIADAFYRWDADALRERLLAYAESGASPAWVGAQIMDRVSELPVLEAYRPYVNALANPARFEPADDRGRAALAQLLASYGEKERAARMLRDAVSSPPSTRAPRTFRLHDGEIRGRLLLNGQPLANTAVRLLSSAEAWRWSEPPERRDDVIKFARDTLIDDRIDLVKQRPDDTIYWMTHPMYALRTDADGRFRFTGLPEGKYVVAVLLGSGLEGWDVRGSRIPDVVTLSESSPRLDAGDVQLRVTPLLDPSVVK